MYYHQVYGLVVPEKGWVPAPRYLLRRYRFLKLMEAMPRGQVLEIGCGAGTLLYDLSQNGFGCVGYESSPQAYDLATYVHRNNPNVEISSVTKESWNGTADYLLAFEVLEHIEDDTGALETWKSWIKPNGYLILSVPAHQKKWNVSDVWAGHFRRYERPKLMQLLEKSGFRVEHVECYGYPLANIVDPIRVYFHRKGFRKQAENIDLKLSRAKNNNRSGVERTTESRFFPLQASWLGVQLMRAFLKAQEWFLNTEKGNGYLIIARPKSNIKE